MADNQTEFVFSAKDEVTPVVTGIVRALGRLDVATGGADKSIGSLERALGGAINKFAGYDAAAQKAASSSRQVTAAEQATADALSKNIAILGELQKKLGDVTLANGRFRSGATGQFVSQTDIQALRNAKTNVDALAKSQALMAETQKGLAKRDLQRALQAQTAEFEKGSTALGRFKQQFTDFPPNSTRYALYDVSQSLAILGAALLSGEIAAFHFAATFERAFADVERTVNDLNQSGLDHLQNQLVDLSKSIPVSFEELAHIGSLGGQLGIAGSGIDEFVESIAKIATVSDLSIDQAATAFGRFKALLGVQDEEFQNLASSILAVGVNSVATESQIVNISTQISSMAGFAGYTADQVIGLSGALASIGAPPELSRGVITRTFSLMSEAVAEGGLSLEAFAKVAGVTGDEFRNAWGTERFSSVFLKFMEGIRKSGGNAVATLHELGITSVRDVPLLMRLAGAADSLGKKGGLLAQTLKDAKTGWEDNTELQRQYEKIASTTIERLKVLGQNFAAFFAAVGTGLLVVMKPLIEGLTVVVGLLEDFASTPFGGTVTGLAVAFAGLAGVVAILGSGMARAVAGFLGFHTAAAGLGPALAGLRVAFAAVWAETATMSGWFTKATVTARGLGAAMLTAFGPVTLILAATAAVAALSAGVSGLQASWDAEGKTLEQRVRGVTRATDQMVETKKNFESFDADKVLEINDNSLANLKGMVPAFAAVSRAIKGFPTFAKLDEDLATLANSGHATEVAKHYKDIQAAAERAGVDQETLNAMFVDTTNALKGLKPEAANVDDAIKLIGEDAELGADRIAELSSTLTKGALAFLDTGTLIKQNQEAQKAAAEATADAWNDQKDLPESAKRSWEEFYDGTKIKLETYLQDLQRQVEAQEAWKKNLDNLSRRGVSDEILTDLARLGPEGAPLVQALVDGTDAQLQQYKDLWARAGADSATAFATAAAANQFAVQNAFKNVGKDAQASLVTALKSGMPIEQVMKKFGLDAAGNPIPVYANPTPAFDETNAYMRWVERQRALLTVGVRLVASADGTTQRILPTLDSYRHNYWSGGYTGAGGKYQEAGTVHKGEFVFDKESTSNIGVGELYRIMRDARGGRSIPRSRRGYAGGGAVSGGGGMMQLDSSSIAGLASVLQNTPIYLITSDRIIAESASRGGVQLAQTGTA